jgi:hypothetical protein
VHVGHGDAWNQMTLIFKSASQLKNPEKTNRSLENRQDPRQDELIRTVYASH